MAANGSTLSLRPLDTFIISCVGKNYISTSIGSGLQPAFAITRSGPASSFSMTASNNEPYVHYDLTVNPGSSTLIYDTVNGAQTGYDHVIVIYNQVYQFTAYPGRGLITMYLPVVRAGDAGSYYCNYMDGSAASANMVNSGSFTLTITTESASSRLYKTNLNKYFHYSLLLFQASKFIY